MHRLPLKQLNLGLVFATFLFAGCFKVAIPENTTQVSNQRNSGREKPGDFILKTQVERAGRESASYDPSVTNSVEIQTTSPSLGGAKVTLEPGTLDISTDIIIEEGAPLHEEVLQELSMASSNVVKGSGVGIIVRSNQDATLQKPMTLEIPLPPVNLWTRLIQDDPYAQVVILYRIQDQADNQMVSGLMPRSSFVADNSLARFTAPGFGEYQAVNLGQTQSTSIEVPSDQPVRNAENVTVLTAQGVVPSSNIQTAENTPAVAWLKPEIKFEVTTRSVTLTGSHTDNLTLKECKVTLQEPDSPATQQTLPANALLSFTVQIAKDSAHQLLGRFVCVDELDRLSTSPWSSVIDIPAKPITYPPATLDQIAFAGVLSDGFFNQLDAATSGAILNITTQNSLTISYSAPLAYPSTGVCEGTLSYLPGIPTAQSLAALSDGSYFQCIKVVGLDGSQTLFGASPTFVVDRTPPLISSLVTANEAADGIVSMAESSSALPAFTISATGHTTLKYTTFLSSTTTCDGNNSYNLSTIPLISQMTADGLFVICAAAGDSAGNMTYQKSSVINRDTGAPIFTSLSGANAATDGIINQSEYLSPAALFVLNASGYNSVSYSNFITTPNTPCDVSVAYSRSSIPLISDLPATDGSYFICVTLADNAGNISYGKSQSILRDVISPMFTSMTAANMAADGFINSTEVNDTSASYVLTASGYSSALFSDFVIDTSTCDSSLTYSRTQIPPPSALPNQDGNYVICAKLADAAMNVTFGKSAAIIRDTVNPVFTSLSLANEAIDGYISAAEVAAPNALYLLNGAGYTTAMYTGLNSAGAGPTVCNNALTYNQSSIPTAAMMPVVDGNYDICVRLADLAGNITYGHSAIVTRDVVAPTSVNISGAPSGTNNIVTLNISVTGVSVTQYRYKVGASASTDCTLANGYSSAIATSTAVADSLASIADGTIKLCVIGGDAAGNFMNYIDATTASWIKDTIPPGISTIGSIVNGNSQITIPWSSVADAVGYMLVRGDTGFFNFTPTSGQFYTVGNVAAGINILYVGPNLSLLDANLTNGKTYGYRVYTYDSVGNYASTSCVTSTLLDNQVPLLKAPFDNAVVNTITPTFSAWNTTSNPSLYYQFQTSTDGFATQNTASLTNIASGTLGSKTYTTGLTNGTIYQWRAQSSFNTGMNWSGWAAPRYIKLDTAVPLTIWQLDAVGAFSSFFPTQTNMTFATTNGGEVSMTGGTTATMTSSPISLDDLGWSRWGIITADIQFSDPTASLFQINLEYDNAGTWTAVPASYYAPDVLNEWVNIILSGLDPTIHRKIRLIVTTTRTSTSITIPTLRILSLSPGNTQSTLTNGDFETVPNGEWVISQTYNAATKPVINLQATDTPQSGTKYAKLTNTTGTLNFTREAWVSQTFAVPVGATQLKYFIKYSHSLWGPVFRFFVNNSMKDQILPAGTSGSSGWVQKTIDVSAYAGQTITFTFGFYDATASAGNTDHTGWLGVDNVTIQ